MKITRIILIIIALLLFASGVWGACVTPTEDYSVTGSIVLCTGTYQLNDTAGNGAIAFGGNGYTLDLNGSTLRGNGTASSVGILCSARSGITIKNGFIDNYTVGVGLGMFTACSGVTIQNVTVTNTNNGLRLRNSDTSTFINNNISNCVGASSKGIVLDVSSSDTNNIGGNVISQCTYGIYEDVGTDNIIENNTISHTNTSGDIYGIVVNAGTTAYIGNNTIRLATRPTSDNTGTTGIRFTGAGIGSTATANTIIGGRQSIVVIDTSTAIDIVSNYVYNSSFTAISCGAKTAQCNIVTNYVDGTGWNGIATVAPSTIIQGNTVKNFAHGGIDCHTDINETLCAGTQITFNTITRDNGATSDVSGIYLDSTNNVQVIGNTITNIINDTSKSGAGGIGIDGANYSYSNWIEGNTIDTISGFCIYDAGLNNTWYDNELSNCDKDVRMLSTSEYLVYPVRPKMINNTFDSTPYYNITSSNVSASINSSDPFTFGAGNALTGANFTICSSLNCAVYTPAIGQLWEVKESGSCTMPSDNYQTSGSTTTSVCNGEYYINDTDTNGVFRFGTGTGHVLDCRQAIFHGGNNTNSKFATTYDRSGVTIKNCRPDSYDIGIQTNGASVNSIVQNNTFGWHRSYGVLVYSNGSQIINNTFNNASTYVQNTKDILYDGNTCWKYAPLNGYTPARAECLFLDPYFNVTVSNNRLSGGQYAIYMNTPQYGINIINNYIEKSDRAIKLNDVTGNSSWYNTIQYNTFFNNSGDYDSYNLELESLNSTYWTFDHNTVQHSPDVSISVQGSDTFNITHNSFDMVCLDGRDFPSTVHSKNMPCTAISIAERYKGYCYINALGCNTGNIDAAASNNYNVIGNTFDDDTMVYLTTQRTPKASYTHDLTNYCLHNITWNGFTNETLMYVNQDLEYITTTGPNRLAEVKDLDGTTYRPYNITKYTTLFRTESGLANYSVTAGSLLSCYSYNDVYLQNNSMPYASDINVVTLSVNQTSNRDYIISYPTSTSPRLTEIGTGITGVDIDYTDSQTLNVNVTGSGYVNISNLAITYGVYNILNGTTLKAQRVTYDSYNISHGNWLFFSDGYLGRVLLTADKSAIAPGDSVAFSCSAQYGNAPLTYSIDYGDGSSASASSGTHTYANIGQYTTVCTVVDADGDTGTSSTVTIVSPHITSGSSGGGSIPTVIQREEEVSKPKNDGTCSIQIEPNPLVIDADHMQITATITNSELNTIKVSPSVIVAMGSVQPPGRFSVSSGSLEIPGGQSKVVTITYSRPLFGSKDVNTTMRLALLGTQCREVYAPINVNVAGRSSSGAQISVGTYLTSDVSPAVHGVPVFAVYCMIYVLGMLVFAGWFSKAFKRGVGNGIGAMFLIYLVCSFAAAGIVYGVQVLV